jgi:hypothetical protein
MTRNKQINTKRNIQNVTKKLDKTYMHTNNLIETLFGIHWVLKRRWFLLGMGRGAFLFAAWICDKKIQKMFIMIERWVR